MLEWSLEPIGDRIIMFLTRHEWFVRMRSRTLRLRVGVKIFWWSLHDWHISTKRLDTMVTQEGAAWLDQSMSGRLKSPIITHCASQEERSLITLISCMVLFREEWGALYTAMRLKMDWGSFTSQQSISKPSAKDSDHTVSKRIGSLKRTSIPPPPLWILSHLA